MSTSKYEYDTFISYSHQNTDWVKSTLLPALNRWDIRYMIDFLHFRPGTSTVSEIERACNQCRTILLVLTPEYLQSSYAQFEYQVGRTLDSSAVQGRVIPLIRELCAAPPILSNVAPISLTDPIDDRQWTRLYDAIIERGESQRHMIGGHADIWRDISHMGGYGYQVGLLVGNPLPVPFDYDALVLRFHPPIHSTASGLTVREEVVAIIENRIHSFFFYGQDRPSMLIRDTEGRSPSIRTLLGNKAFELPLLSTGSVPTSTPGHGAACLSLRLTRRGVPVSEILWCALPPPLRLPMFYQADKEAKLTLDLVPECYVPTESGIGDDALVDVIFDAASEAEPRAKLTSIHPEAVTVHTFNDGVFRHTTHNWIYEFSAYGGRKTLSIHKDDPTFVRTASSDGPEPTVWLGKEFLRACTADCRAASLVAEAAGARQTEHGPIALKPGFVAGALLPIWSIPFKLQDRELGVVATTGEVVMADGSTAWAKVKGCIWNT